MRGEREWPRGETGRVAARVHALLADREDPTTPGMASGPDEDLARVPVAGVRAGRSGTADVDLADDDFDERFDDGRGPQHGGFAEPSAAWARRLAARVPLRLDPSRRAALGVGVAVLLAAVITGLWLVSSRPPAVPVSAAVPSVPGTQPLVGTDGAAVGTGSSASSAPQAGASSSGPAEVVVDVAGKVARPGVYRLPAGSGVGDAISRAGGAVRHVNLDVLNLAAVLVDGEQVAVGVPPASAAPGAGGLGASGAATGTGGAGSTVSTVDLNTATLEQLETLPGVGPVLGQNILDYRTAHGSFTGVADLKNVTGIGDVRFAQLQPLVTV